MKMTAWGHPVDHNPMLFHRRARLRGFGDAGDTPAPSTYPTPAGPQPSGDTVALNALQDQLNATVDVVSGILTGEYAVGAVSGTPASPTAGLSKNAMLLGAAGVALVMVLAMRD